jgi:hypothetical protein
MYFAPVPEHTKQTRCNNNLNVENNRDFFRPVISNPARAISSQHEHYIQDKNVETFQHNKVPALNFLTNWDSAINNNNN